MQIPFSRTLRPLVLCVFVILPVRLWAEEAREPQRLRFANGIEAVVYPPQYILENMTKRVDKEDRKSVV